MAGQGMNVSMMDTYNLGWKVALVCKGIMCPSILKTYESERREVAQDLIEFDRKSAKLWSGPGPDTAGLALDGIKRATFISGVGVAYGPSNLVATSENLRVGKNGTNLNQPLVTSDQRIAKGIPVGERFNSFQIVNQADGRHWHSQDLFPSDGRWRLVVFAGDILDTLQRSRINSLGKYLDSAGCFLRRYTPASATRSIFQILTIHSSPRFEVELGDFPRALRSEHDYHSVYVDEGSKHNVLGKAYENYGIDAKKGCLVIVRPDQYTSLVCELEDTNLVDSFFEGCFLDQTK